MYFSLCKEIQAHKFTVSTVTPVGVKMNKVNFAAFFVALLIVGAIASPRKVLEATEAGEVATSSEDHQRILAELEEVSQLRERMLQEGKHLCISACLWCTIIMACLQSTFADPLLRVLRIFPKISWPSFCQVAQDCCFAIACYCQQQVASCCCKRCFSLCHIDMLSSKALTKFACVCSRDIHL